MTLSYSHGREFVCELRPLLEARDLDGLSDYLGRRWPECRLREVLDCGYDDAAKTALLCLALRGTPDDCPAIVRMLRHRDPFMVLFAEHALWSIWFRAGDDNANHRLTYAVQLLSEDRLGEAEEELSRIIRRRPDFAEPYNQRAIVHFLRGDYEQAQRDCERTLQLNPQHFGARAGLGHCFVATGRLREALAAYRAVLRIHPRAEGIAEAAVEVRRLLQRDWARKHPRPSPAN